MIKKRKNQPRKIPIPSKDLINLIYFDSTLIEHKVFAIQKIKKMHIVEFTHYVAYAKNFNTINHNKISWTSFSAYVDKYRQNNILTKF